MTEPLSPAEIVAAGRGLPETFACRLALTDPSGNAATDVVLICDRVLRLLPGRRLTARARLDERPVLLKLFLGAGAARYRSREERGCRLIADAGVATPGLVGRVAAPAEETAAVPAEGLLFDYLDGAEPLSPDDDAGFEAAAAALARLHDAGALHRDPHPENFLFAAGRAAPVHLVDGDGVRPMRGRVGRRRGLSNLALLCAQRSPAADDGLQRVLEAYAGARGWAPETLAATTQRLACLTASQRRARVRAYLGKTLRDCSEFRCTSSWRRRFVCLRSVADGAFDRFADDPEGWLQGAALIKGGGSATVTRGRLGDRPVVVKRYNLKDAGQAVRRALRPRPRYRLAWQNGHRLWFLGLPTARPLALLEHRFGPLRGRAYLVMEDLGDRDLQAEIAAEGLSERRLAQLVELFRALDRAGLRHGDTKASNFLIQRDAVHLVDLDALAPGRRGQVGDRRRFLDNFAGQPAVRQRIERAFRAAGLALE
ncbi:MAG TPA: lipopolysaccharide kinase InaA family protein [Pseudomonadales bacterium]